MTISLIGLPGSGKTSMGQWLARQLKWNFLDSDAIITQQIQCSIADFFVREGEARFRDLEAALIDELSQKSDSVLSTGGGVVLRAQNRDHLRTRTKVIYLKATPLDLFRRLRHDTQRPLLQVADPLRRLHELYSQRHALYQQTAHFQVPTGTSRIDVPLRAILMQLELDGWHDPT